MRLIDADKLFPYGAVPYVENDGFKTADKLYGIIKNAPTVDAVEVVRCKDCIYCTNIGMTSDCFKSYGMTFVNPDDFCSYGERKSNETD